MININWKEEGYKVGEKALFISNYYHQKSILEDVDITYVGTKILKIKRDGKIIEFKGHFAQGITFGDDYGIYKNKQEYELIIQANVRRIYLIDKITKSVDNLSTEKLKQIDNIIDNKKE